MAEGAEKAKRVAHWLARVGIKSARIYRSGEKRARQAAEMLGQALGAPEEEAEGLGPNDDSAIWREKLSLIAED